PGIATVYALEELDGGVYLVAEHIDGKTLRDEISDGPLPLADVLATGRAVADAVAFAHDHGVIHRDLKPENVIRAADRGTKILDFGLARIVDASPEAGAAALTAAGAVFGTPAYMSPEQLRGETADAASDIFALGVMLAELSSGRHPFGGERGPATMAKILSAEPDLSGVPAPLRPVVAGCLEKSAGDRFRSAHEVRAALDTVARGETPRRADRAAAFWWWQFHQAGASVFSISVAVAIWLVWGWLPRTYAPAILVAAIFGGFGATTLRLHQWFSARMYPADDREHRISMGARANDLILSAAALVSGLLIESAHPAASALLIASAVVMIFISFIVEPATARAANRH
ncbi:MAG: serine/threonine protein kinase, partial [Acidobacteria bacterium]